MRKEEALPTLRAVASWLEESGQDVVVCGAARRGAKEIEHTDIVIRGPLVQALADLEEMCKLVSLECAVLEQGDQYAALLVNEIQLALHVVYQEAWGAHILYYTGNQVFRVAMAAEAKSQGYKLNSRGLWHRSELIAGRTEEQIFDALDLAYIPPTRRTFRWKRNRKPLRRKGEICGESQNDPDEERPGVEAQAPGR
jgi:DNA polymerase (family 10)